MSRYIKQFSEMFFDVSNDIFKFCQALRFNPTPQQRQLMEAVQRGDKRIAVKSGQGVGKSSSSAIVTLWRTIRAHKAMTVLTAPTMRQAKDVWLTEARRLLEGADPWLQKFIKITKTRIIVAGDDDWGVRLVTASREENAQGYHQSNLTVIGEEASGIPREIITQFKGTLKNEDSLFILIGNPNTRDSAFFDCFNNQRHLWTTLTWNSEEIPESPWFSQSTNELIAQEYGRDSDVYRIRVLGQFPHADPNCVLSSEQAEQASDPEDMLKCVAQSDTKQFALDFARYGGDENVVMQRSGNAVVDWKFWAHVDPSVAVGEAFAMQAASRWADRECWYVADASGMGQGILHRFYDAKKQTVEFHNGGAATQPGYKNKITEAWFEFAKKIREGKANIPRDNRLIQQLSGRRYYPDAKGKLVLESKEDYIKRGFDSPDRADACVMAFWDRHAAQSSFASAASSSPERNIGVQVRR